MNYSFEYIDIILLAMIAGFIFLRLRGILGKRTGFEGKAPSQLKEVLKTVNRDQPKKTNEKFAGSWGSSCEKRNKWQKVENRASVCD